MPLLRRKPFPLAEPPKDLEPRELVYQVRFTKEIFRDYQYPCFVILQSYWYFYLFYIGVMSLASHCFAAEKCIRKHKIVA